MESQESQESQEDHTMADQVSDFLVNGSDVLVGKSATKTIRSSMTKSEWFAKMTPEQKTEVTEIAYLSMVKGIYDFFADYRIPVNKDQIPEEFRKTLKELQNRSNKETSAEDILLEIGDLIDDGQDWLPEGGED